MIVFVGDRPSAFCTDLNVAFKGAKCEERLTQWIAAINEGKEGEPDVMLVNSFSVSDITTLVNIHAASASSDAKFVALGNSASRRLSDRGIPHFKLPHPSGRNRQINDKDLILSKLAACRAWLACK